MSNIFLKIAQLVIFLFFLKDTNAQEVLIHAHNDYEKKLPLINALLHKADIIEADVFPVDGKLYVAHHKNEIKKNHTLDSLYILPIVQQRKQLPDDTTRFALCIDIKEDPAEAIRLINHLLQPYLKYFDRSVDENAVQIIISGERGNIHCWKNYPAYIYFDGRPYETYDGHTLHRVAMISDNHQNYKNESELKAMIDKVHTLGKPVRLWAAPDHKEGWTNLIRLGVDIINTDDPAEARALLRQVGKEEKSGQ